MSLVTQVSDLATAIGTEIKSARTDFAAVTGSLASLSTTDKANLVAAINEIFAAAGSGVTNLAATLSATQTIITCDTGTDATIPAADTVNAGVMTKSMFDKLTAIEALADVTDATNVDAAGAVMTADTTTAGMGFVVDEDDMLSDLATKVPTQQSVKAYVIATANAAAAAVVDAAPGALDTLNELAAALGDDAAFATTTATALGNRVRTDTAAQGLDATQKSNARTNIDVFSTTQIGDVTTDLAAVFAAALL
jgi:23S rRNA U2552 (ribose-2'-O)-methylase RlmE/FtsJ